jgi:excinuclease ABC subunit B
MTEFRLVADFEPKGSQPEAIRELVEGLGEGDRFQTLLGVTGSGKTFTVANVIEAVRKPTLVIAHNKTLAAQLYNEFREFFPENRVEYFVSYYDYYQPESYLPKKDQYIEKDAQINPKIEQMRLAATASLLSRPDTIVVASVSCIYGLGNPENFREMGFELKVGDRIDRKQILGSLVEILFERNDIELMPGRFRVKGDTIDLIPGYFNNIIRIELFGDEIDRITEIDKVTGQKLDSFEYFFVYPARHFVTPEEETKRALASIKEELDEYLPTLGMIEQHRLKQRTLYDLEMIEETGTCKGIENYSRHFDNRRPGEKPFCLLDYFPEDFLIVIDESHQTIPQIHGMYNGDYSRKRTLVEYGFRLPSALDNRPLKFEEFAEYMRKNRVVFVSATPAAYEREQSARIVEQIIRPTGLVDPAVEVRPIEGQTLDVMREIEASIAKGDRVLITTLTKKLAEELTEFLAQQGIRTRYLHSDIKTIERTEIIRQLRLGTFDVLVGINLLREGLDIPEVGFIGILDVLTGSIKEALAETERRRRMQVAYNEAHGIVPKTIIKPIREKEVELTDTKHLPKSEIPNLIIELDAQMREAADSLDFERAIRLRDHIRKLEKEIGEG